MGCCGCTLQTSAIVAAVFGIIESLAGLIAGIITAQSYKYTADYYGHPFSTFRNVLISATVFNVLWLVATIILIIGIVKENAVMHRIWVGATSVMMVVDLAHTIALIVLIVTPYYSYSGYSSNTRISYNTYASSYYDYNNSYYSSSYSTAVFLFVLLMTAVSRGSVWLWIINICLTIYTAHRANEIEKGPVQPGTVVHVYGQPPIQPYPMTGQTIIVQHTGPSTGMPPNYSQQHPQYGYPQAQYGQPQAQYGQPQGQYGPPQEQYGQPPANPYDSDQGIPPKY